ncbi:FAD-dependent oxidoreductase [Streptomyces sp. HNM0574]|uniref:flavin monoamine oxidase family protein n=1 Tax=Streptomyces sp. HNM0574 TaxID=2714954 RepID=UPI00146EBC29|nr:FAD-dependent oxidoreductase [Streptomyces sp. HNM0574]NLU65803.1 NAD(P)-binding protein [Streptomyces sp. HNM0574]
MSPQAELPAQAPAVVIGAGYAGLSAALNLTERGIPAVLLEASARVGGRVLTERRGTAVIDHGGQWAGPTQHRLLAWAERFGCATFPTWNTGKHLELWHDGTRSPYDGAGPDEGPGMAEYLAAAERLDELAAHIRLDAPAGTPRAEEWDSETVHSWCERTVASPAARRRLALAVQGVWSCEPRDLSLFHLLFYIAAAGSFDELMETEGCAQERRFADGAQAPALAAAAHLGDRLHLNTPVLRVEQLPDGVRVHTARGSVRAERVVVATPPQATTGIAFSPQLPLARRRWLHRSPMGDVAKVHACYDRPFWREAGLSGQATLYGEHPVGVVFDNSPEDAASGTLVAFVYGDRLRHWQRLDADARRREVLGTLTELFGPDAGEPRDYTEKIWPSDTWAGGGYAAVPTPGTWHAYGEDGWRAPAGRVHWAGTESASVWNGYIDGAIASGERAAEEIAAAWKPTES